MRVSTTGEGWSFINNSYELHDPYNIYGTIILLRILSTFRGRRTSKIRSFPPVCRVNMFLHYVWYNLQPLPIPSSLIL